MTWLYVSMYLWKELFCLPGKTYFRPQTLLVVRGRVWRITLLGSVLLESHGFLKKFLKLLSDLQRDWTVLLQFSKCLWSTIFSLFVISRTQSVGWLMCLSFLHQHQRQHSSAQDTLCKVYPRPFLVWLAGLGARLDTNDQFMCCPSYLCLNCT